MKTILTLLALIGAVAAADLAYGQPSFRADRKITGEAYRPYSARTYSRHAVGHANVLGYYRRVYPELPPETAMEHATEVRRNVTGLEKELDKLAKELPNDEVVVKLIADIRGHLDQAKKECHMLEEECAKHSVPGGTADNCCTRMWAELKAADESHDKLLKHLKVPLPTPAPKEPAPTETKQP